MKLSLHLRIKMLDNLDKLDKIDKLVKIDQM